ncbi:hypothetical protein LCGC14_2682160 [marine sediment metagenome]|uniref:Uncharacterized protein n=1 Tax=marine sediment metagenome TaxID=412755 RepID=A0A0F9BVU2_9ZZZZ
MAQKTVNWQRIRFTCVKCGNESWTEFNVDTYVLKVENLVCDDCMPEDVDEEVVVKVEVL